MAEEQKAASEVELDLANKKVKLRGSDIIAGSCLVVSICGFTIGYFLWATHTSDAKENGSAIVLAVKEMTRAQQEGVKEQRVLNCLISTEQRDRRRAYDECERIAR